ncbi:MAG: hypothetical protein CUN52_05925 [Phototrophicales bacterium]|nr:MAG: hypothetical protein CUN52_05925 [Phototrophicales bacterium]
MNTTQDDEIIEQVIIERGRGTNWGCVLVAFSPVAICSLAILGSVLFCGNTFGNIWSGVQNVFSSIGSIFNLNLFPGSTQIVTSPSIVERIRPLGQLVTTRVELANARIEVSTRYGVANVCYIGALHSAQGSIEAGVNLDGFSSENVTYDEARDMYILRIPQPTVTNCQLDPMQVIKYHDWGDSVVCPADWDEMRLLASYEAINNFRDRAVEEDIIGKAERQADLILSNFVSSITGKSVLIEFIPATEMIYPRSCMPEPPSTWRYDEEAKRWVKD